jgi:hypothetical protein
MKKNNFFKMVLPILAAVMLTAFKCGGENAPVNDTITKVGMIRYYAPPDNCNDYVFTTDNENGEFDLILKPDSLSDEFKVDLLDVKVTYKPTNQKHNCGFGGEITVINILNIERL